MPFPPSKRVLYGKNPLVEVICQLRFPPILRIGSQPPAAFQDSIRTEYPLLREKQSVQVEQNVPQEFIGLMQAALRRQAAYDFISEDERWTVALTNEFVALSTRCYERWEDFRARLERVLDALSTHYSPGFYTRIGLRYRDVIIRSRLDLSEVPWSELLNRFIAGELAANEIGNDVQEALRVVKVKLTENSSVRVRHGLTSGEPETPSEEMAYTVDADFFNENKRTETNNALGVLQRFNRSAGHLFRWCITERLHEAMEPREIPDAGDLG